MTIKELQKNSKQMKYIKTNLALLAENMRDQNYHWVSNYQESLKAKGLDKEKFKMLLNQDNEVL